MIVLLGIAIFNSDQRSSNFSIRSQNTNSKFDNQNNTSMSSILKNSAKKDLKTNFLNYNKRLLAMVLAYSILFSFCQLPYEIYRCVMLWNQNIENNLWNRGLDFAIEIPLLILKLINRCANPYLFICLGDIYGLRRGLFRCFCIPCCPGCIGCNECWCKDCSNSIKYEYNHCMGNVDDSDDWIPTGIQTISTHQYRDGGKLVTKHTILEEYETNVQPYYKQPKPVINVNEAFENDDNLRFINFGNEEQLRRKV